MGYAVECALKACVAKQVRRYDFPDKKLANEAFTHDLEKLVRVSGLWRLLEQDDTRQVLLRSKRAICIRHAQRARMGYSRGLSNDGNY